MKKLINVYSDHEITLEEYNAWKREELVKEITKMINGKSLKALELFKAIIEKID